MYLILTVMVQAAHLAAPLDSTSPFFGLCLREAQRTMLLNSSKLLFFCTTLPWENIWEGEGGGGKVEVVGRRDVEDERKGRGREI